MIDQNKLDALFVKAKSAPHTSVFNETKEQFLIVSSGDVNKTSSKKDHFITFNKGIIMLIIAGAITMTLFLMSGDIEENNKTQITAQTEVELMNEIIEEEAPSLEKNTLLNTPSKTIEVLEVNEVNGLIPNPILEIGSINRGAKLLDSIERNGKAPKNDQNSDFVFPKLTEKEISDNHRRKKKMLKALNRKDKKVYSYIPSGSFTYKSKPISVQAFHIQRTEVTNLEYKTFLFDLLIQDRKADFIVAKPKQELWTEELGEEYRYMQDDYFSSEDYKDYPVNNISRKGAELYCDWITREANKINKEDGKTLINDARIPMRAEWVKAATVEGKFLEYPWNDDLSVIFFLCNFSLEGFVIPTAKNKKTGKTFMVGHDGAITSGGRLRGENLILTRSESYGENDYGLYNMCGNVAEMVYESVGTSDLLDKSQLKSGTAGGGWMNTVEEVKLNAEDLYQGIEDEHLNIGFRVVITHFNPSK